MNTRYTRPSNRPRTSLAPGDQVIRYVNGQPFFCTVVEVQPDESVRVSCNLWPSGYSALVQAQEVALVSRSGMPVDM
jgi:hypothetical protein